jgi:glycosyltransferase involved in cell wall biosynthesis
MRKRFIQSHFDQVDLFLAPSEFLLERFVAWGIPRGKIRVEENGYVESSHQLGGSTSPALEPRNRFGFFGQFNEFKGVDVLLKAMVHLKREKVDARLWLYGANLDIQPGEFQRDFKRLLQKTKDNVIFGGSFRHEEHPKLLQQVDWVVIPSIWWENSPLVVREAFAHGRPVICSDIGGMAEKVTDGVNGLHFRVGDPIALANTIKLAASEPELWDRLTRGIPPVYGMEDHVASLKRLYRELLGPEPSRQGAAFSEVLT